MQIILKNPPDNRIKAIKDLRSYNIKGLSSLYETKRFVMDGAVALVSDSVLKDILIPLFGAKNMQNYDGSPLSINPNESEVSVNLSKFSVALEWYNSLSGTEKENADLIIKVYSKVINNQDVTELVESQGR